jgi:hypothetical protein
VSNNFTEWPADAVERRALSELIPYARNSRTHSDAQVAQIAASIREWGWTMPVLIDENGNVIAGHGRLLAAQKLGLLDVPCMTANGWSEAKRRAYVIADNKIALNAGWDVDLLKIELEEIRDIGFDIELTGFSESIFEDSLFEENGESYEDYSAPSEPKKTDDEYAEFCVVLLVEEKKRLLSVLKKIKDEHGAQSHEDALKILVETYGQD